MIDNSVVQASKKRVYKISHMDKIALCKGVLANISVKEKLKYLKMPIIYVYSKKNCLVHLKHSEAIKDSADRNIPLGK